MAEKQNPYENDKYQKLRFHMMKSSLIGMNFTIVNSTIQRVDELSEAYYSTARALDYSDVDQKSKSLVLKLIRDAIHDTQLGDDNEDYKHAVSKLHNDTCELLLEKGMNVAWIENDIVYVRHIDAVQLVEINCKLYKLHGTFLEKF